MTDPVFQEAYDTVRRAHSDKAWASLTPRQITEALYREIRRIDALRAAPATAPAPKRRARPGAARSNR